MRNRFTSQLEALNDGIIEMGALVEEAFAEATEAFLYFNKEQAQRNIDNDKDIDQKMKDIETLCLRLLLSQQPVARDLRLISASLKMVSDLERIGDQCANISEIVLTLAQKSTNPHSCNPHYVDEYLAHDISRNRCFCPKRSPFGQACL